MIAHVTRECVVSLLSRSVPLLRSAFTLIIWLSGSVRFTRTNGYNTNYITVQCILQRVLVYGDMYYSILH